MESVLKPNLDHNLKTLTEMNKAVILIVDDQIENVQLLQKLLTSEGFTRIFTTTDPRQAESIYLKENPDLVILDLKMPHMDGFEVLEKIKEVDPKYSPVLVLTAQSDRKTHVFALKAGARDFVGKPFDREEILARVRNLLEVRLLQRRIIFENANLERKVQLRTEELTLKNLELEKLHLEIVQHLGRACEFRDNETGLHIIRMSNYTRLLALATYLDAKFIELIFHASPMHDVGKVGIPDAILLKPGKLTPDEFKVMATHPQIGASIIEGSKSELLGLARSIALTHHEKWDGSGYPKGLKGEKIPIEGRIVAIADVFDALTSERPYKKAWSVEDAMNYINTQSGKHFDPALVALMPKVLPEFKEIMVEYQELPAFQI